MLHVDVPTLPEIKALVMERHPASVSLYLPVTPLTQDVGADRIEFDNMVKDALGELKKGGADKNALAALSDQLADLSADDEFWKYQANSLAVLATPEQLRTFRLPNALTPHVETADRFHLKPLIRSVTFRNEAYVLALSENKTRFIEVFRDLPPQKVKVRGLPKSASDALKKATINDRSHSRRIHGSEGQNVRLRQYARIVDGSLRSVLAGRETPLILAAADPLAAIFPSVNTYPHLLGEVIKGGPDEMKPGELAEAARPILDAHYAAEVAALRKLYTARAKQDRATSDPDRAARAATFGAVDTLLMDIDASLPGTVGEKTGKVKFAKQTSAASYDIVDEIAGRVLMNGGRVLGVRKKDMPDGAELAAILRYAI